MKRMKLVTLGVQEMSRPEMIEQLGGCGWCKFRDKYLNKPLEFVADRLIKKGVDKLLGALGI